MVNLLPLVNIFTHLNKKEHLDLADNFTIVKSQPGDHIVEAGKKADSFFILYNGKINKNCPFLSNVNK